MANIYSSTQPLLLLVFLWWRPAPGHRWLLLRQHRPSNVPLMWVFTGEFTIWMWCCSRKSARCSNRTIPEPSACFICCMPVSGNVHTQCKRQFLPWRIYNLNKQASQTLRWRKCYCIFYIFLCVWGKKERRCHSKLLQSIHWSCWICSSWQKNPPTESGVEPDPVYQKKTQGLRKRRDIYPSLSYQISVFHVNPPKPPM